MVLELLYNAVLLILFAYCYYYIGATMPASAPTELGAEQWPQLILSGLIVLILINMFKIYKTAAAEERNFDQIKNIKLQAILRSRLFQGIVIILVYAASLAAAGFILSTYIFFIVYARLIGEKRIKFLAGSAFVMTFSVYFLFARGLSIMLPRGYGILRDFALMLESF